MEHPTKPEEILESDQNDGKTLTRYQQDMDSIRKRSQTITLRHQGQIVILWLLSFLVIFNCKNSKRSQVNLELFLKSTAKNQECEATV